MKLSFVVDYALEPAEEKTGLTPEQLTVNLIRTAIDARYPRGNGAKEETAIMVGARVQKAISRAIKDDADGIEVTLDQVEWIHASLKAWREGQGVPGGIFHHFLDLWEHVESVIKAAKAEKKTG